jgi:pimeloyl-ACP methyl ester carboxylesterase
LQFRSVGDVMIDYDVWGSGAPVLLIHGFASNARVNWVDTGWVATLNRAGYQAITFDNRGHGRSTKLYEERLYRPELMAEDAKSLAQHLGHAQFPVMGYSMGARIAAILAINHASLVQAAVLAGLAANLMKGLGDTERIAMALEADAIPEPRDPESEAYRRFAEQTRSDLKALASCMRASRQGISREELARIQIPVLVVAGSEDRTAGPVEPLVSAIPKARGVVLPGLDHMKAVGDRRFKEEVVKFLDSLHLP